MFRYLKTHHLPYRVDLVVFPQTDQVLDEFCETTGYCRSYARYVLRNHGRQVWLRGKRISVGDVQEAAMDAPGCMMSMSCRSWSNSGTAELRLP
jgi:hypothetical protein